MRLEPWTIATHALKVSRNLILNLIDPPVIVLLYHRVSKISEDSEMLAVSPEYFQQHLHHLKNNFPIVRFEDDWSKITSPSVAVTFDDGYADNVLEAFPILEEAGVPATFFISSGAIGSSHELWWDEMNRIFLSLNPIRTHLSLGNGKIHKEWKIGNDVERRAVYRELVNLLTDADIDSRNDLLNQIRSWADVRPETDGTNRAVTETELLQLSKSTMATIGAHTVTHARLSALTVEAQRVEIESSIKQLESLLGKKISVFSYPYGRPDDYTDKTVTLCREAGIVKAAVNFPGQAHRWTDPYQIPRHLVRNWPVDIFAEKLKKFWRS
ncbi:MAG TPA: polysaccharide deacetylase family protein [Syntrophales bacterium]|nr:polysaccharide deacetylase family protein [Syntrophales bacterium]